MIWNFAWTKSWSSCDMIDSFRTATKLTLVCQLLFLRSTNALWNSFKSTWLTRPWSTKNNWANSIYCYDTVIRLKQQRQQAYLSSWCEFVLSNAVPSFTSWTKNNKGDWIGSVLFCERKEGRKHQHCTTSPSPPEFIWQKVRLYIKVVTRYVPIDRFPVNKQ